MTLALFILGIAIILGISRYNESNKLFWILFTCYVLGFAGVKAIYDTFGTEEQSEQSLDQAYPTQGLTPTGTAIACFFDTVGETTLVKETSNPVGQAITPDYIEPLFTLSDVSGATQGLTVHALPNPPNSVKFVDTS